MATLLIGDHVDDLIINGSNIEDITKLKVQMHQLFEMSDLGLLSYYFGIEVIQGTDVITLCQSAYIDKIFEMASMKGCNACHTLMENRLKLSKASTGEVVDAIPYRRIIDSPRYLYNT